MEVKRISKFCASINDIKFYDEQLFNSCLYLLEHMESKKFRFKDQFIVDLKDLIEIVSYKYEEFSYGVLESDFIIAIDEANKLEDIEFSYLGCDWKISWINENLKNKIYNLKD